MKKQNSRAFAPILIVALMAATGVVAQEAAPAQEASAVNQVEPNRNWVLRFGFLISDTLGDSSVTVEPGGVDVSINGGGGGFVNLERMVSPLVGIELNLIGLTSDLNISNRVGHKHSVYSDLDLLTMGTIALGANFHFVKDGPVDVYAGPMLAFNRYADLAIRSGVGGEWPVKHDEWTSVRSRTDSEVTWGAKAGLDILIGKKKRWSVGCSLTYLDASYNFRDESGSSGDSISLDPLMLGISGGFRF